MLFRCVQLLWLVNLCSGSSSMPYGQYKFAIFSLEDIDISPLPRTNKCAITKENTTLLAQLTPMRGQDDAANSQLTEHFFWVGAAPHLTLTNVNRTVQVPFSVRLFRRGSVVAWRCQFARSDLNEDLSDVKGGQWRAEVSLSRGSGFFATRASLTDVTFAAWSAWPWGAVVDAATVAPRVGRLRYLQDPCGRDLGLLAGLTAAGQSGLPLATVIGNTVRWYNLADAEMVRAAFGGSPPAELSLTSAVLTSAHLFLLTSHGLLVSSAFRGPETDARPPGASFTLLRLHTNPDVSPGDRAKDELVHSLSCFSNKEDNETVLLLLHSESHYLLGRAPFHLASSWRDLRSLVSWPAGLAAVRDVRYIWHWGAIFLGYDEGDAYHTAVLPLRGAAGGGRRPCDRLCGAGRARQPHVLLCPLTKKVYLLSDRLSVSMDGGATFAEPPNNLTFGRVEHCVTDLVDHHLCVTVNMELVIIGVGSDEPEKIPLKDVSPNLNITEAAKTALIMDQAGGVTVYGVTGSAGFSSYYFNLESGLPRKYEASCDYYLQLLGGVKHASMIHLDVHDVVTVQVEARRVHVQGSHSEWLAADSQAIDLELSNPSVVHVQRAVSVRDAAVRLAATVRPNSWTSGAVCAVTFRLSAVSALCSRTSRVVTFALSPAHHAVVVDIPRGRHPKEEADVMRHVRAGDSVFYELPVNYRPPSDLGINIPTSDNIYNADPSQPLNQGLLIEHAVSRRSGRFQACAGKTNRTDCGCSREAQYSTHVRDSDCRVHVPMMSWPGKLRLTMSIRDSHRPRRPLQAPIYVNITELNNRSSWENHVLLDSNLAQIYLRNLSTRDRRLVDPQRIRILMKGTGLYHFRIRVVEHTSFNADHDDVLVYVVPARLKSQVQHVVYPMVGITLIVILFVVFEYYHQRYAGADDDSESESEEEPTNAAPPASAGGGYARGTRR